MGVYIYKLTSKHFTNTDGVKVYKSEFYAKQRMFASVWGDTANDPFARVHKYEEERLYIEGTEPEEGCRVYKTWFNKNFEDREGACVGVLKQVRRRKYRTSRPGTGRLMWKVIPVEEWDKLQEQRRESNARFAAKRAEWDKQRAEKIAAQTKVHVCQNSQPVPSIQAQLETAWEPDTRWIELSER